MAAVENNFRTRSSVRSITQDTQPQTVEQTVALEVSPSATAFSRTRISTEGGSTGTTVKTDTISSKNEEFVRYAEITTDQKNSKGEQLNFDHVLNIWGRTGSDQTSQPGQVYGEAVLGVILTGNFSASARKQLMEIVVNEKVYVFDEKTLSRTTVNGRPVYGYDVKVAPTAYIKLLQKYGQLAGMAQLQQLDPAQYANAEPLTFRLSVDVWSQRLTAIEYTGGARKEAVSSFGVTRDFEKPKEYITVEELQTKLQQAQE